jgi:hypothetical protein|tara:strand:- start:11 stop:2911 length:2901 start_codon:yes stop_codon:yes gene_type:complete
MAAVTLKDLMDPLTKIQAATESTAASIDQLTMTIAAGGQVGDGIQSAILAELQLQTKLMEKKGGGGLSSLFGGGGGGNAKGLADGGNAFKLLGAGTSQMAKALLLFMLVPKGTLKKFNLFVVDMVKTLGDMDAKKVEEGGKTLGLLGDSILSFVKGLALSALLLIPAAIGIPLLYISVGLLVPLFFLLGMGEKQIKAGANALDNIGDALKSFALGLAGFALVTFFILMQPVILLGMVASLVLISGAVALIGMFDKQINKGAVSLAMMGIGLTFFGIGYALFALTIAATAPTLEAIAIQAGILVGIGVVTAILGSLFSLIIQGAASLAAMGIGLIIFGIGYMPFAFATKDTTLEDVGIQAALLTAIGGVFALAGVGALFILAGAAAFAAVGGALLLLAPGLSAIQKVDFTEDDALKLTTTLAGVKAAFIGPPGKGGIGGFFSSIGGALTGAVDSVKMIAAAAGFAAAGMALTKLSAGLKDYQKLDWTDAESLKLTGVLSGITTAFAQAGGEAATPTGLFGAVFGNAFSPNATKKGISSVMGAGKALKSIAVGLTEFQKLVDKDVDFNVLGESISLTVGFIQRAFAAVADEGNVDAGGFFGSLFGIKKNKVAEGLDAVQGAGSALTGIAEGLTEFQKLVESKVDFDAVGIAISKSVGFVQEAFAAVAEEGNVKAGGFWGSLLGIKKNKVQEGIQSVQGAGAELKQIADGLSTFAGIENPQEVAGKIKAVIGMVGNAFAAVGGMEQKDSGFFGLISWDENLVEKGIDAVDGAGAALTDIASGLKAFSQDGLEPEKVARSISSLLTSIGQTFADLYTTNPFISMQLDDFAEFIVTIGDVAEKGQLDKAADGISKIADAVNKIEIDKAIAFGDLFKSSSQLTSDRGAYKALAKAVEDIRDMMGEQGGGGPNMFEKAANFVDGGSRGKSAPAPSSSKGNSDKRLLSTLSEINSTLKSLPADIMQIELKVTPS